MSDVFKYVSLQTQMHSETRDERSGTNDVHKKFDLNAYRPLLSNSPVKPKIKSTGIYQLPTVPQILSRSLALCRHMIFVFDIAPCLDMFNIQYIYRNLISLDSPHTNFELKSNLNDNIIEIIRKIFKQFRIGIFIALKKTCFLSVGWLNKSFL